MVFHATLVLLAAACAVALPAQKESKEKLPRYKLDPHTRNEPKALQAAGYVSLGPFPFGERGLDDATTADVEAEISYEPLLWVETAHFRIGSSLPEWTVPLEPEIRNKIRAELEELGKKLPRVNPKTRELSPWLRLHLTAHRLEKAHREWCALLGVNDGDFPKRPEDVIVGQGRFMGYGPHLGMKEKFLFLITDRQGTCVDYLKKFTGRATRFGQRWHFIRTGCLLYAVSSEADEGRLKDDTAMHANLVHNAVHNFLDGYRSYAYDVPVWISEGIAHWFERRVSERFNSYCRDEGAAADPPAKWRWAPEVRRDVLAGKTKPLSELMQWRRYGEIEYDEHMMLWSRWDYLLSLGPEKFAEFMLLVKGRVDEKWMVDQSDLVGASREALQKAYGLTPLSLDERWAAWVKANYPSQ
jgi:hypothetical protein